MDGQSALTQGRGLDEARWNRLWRRLCGRVPAPALFARLCGADLLGSQGGDAALAVRVGELILATRHRVSPTTAAARLLVDLDLSILGRPPAVYVGYAQAIREEYAWLSAQDYAAGRRRVLQGFLERPHLYATEYFQLRYAAQARENICSELAGLRAESGADA